MDKNNPIEKCAWCQRDCYQNQLKESAHQGGKVCPDCRADQGPTLGEIVQGRKEQARAGLEVRP